ncbi:hypothetical protein [Aestuariibacter sp. A3R04]|uniref:hypothetical protein n=1 Tax=Aestuariibacter sp. A3R04 TaxID=2841571 RepID=UPI001C0949B8|nr:hypothetical protein [Aestuariibacter sp. A3R04]MBU3022286.1 hypothetical protein [Aestuariibacter sp. A3R04]
MTPYVLLMSQLLSFPQQPDIKLDVTKSEASRPWAFVAPHENEHVGNAYLKQQVEKFGGVFAILKQHGQRHVTLSVDGNALQADPNRIFTKRGRMSTLTKLNPDLAAQTQLLAMAEKRAQALAEFILHSINANEASSWVAIHNNTQGYDDDGHKGRGTISIKRYQKKLDSGASYLIRVHDAGKDEDDLFFITESTDYEAMKKASFNVVLQNPDVALDPAEDDGSLSVLAEKQGRRYVNVEAERRTEDGFGDNHVAEQQAMIDMLFTILNESHP